MLHQSKVPAGAYQSAYIRLWIAHMDGSINKSLVVFRWKTEKEKRYMFTKNKQLLRNYKIAPIREVRYYENGVINGPILGTMDANGVFHGQMEFMNHL